MVAAGPPRICLGVVTAPHGVRGEVRIRSFTERPEDVVAYGDLSDEAGERCFRARSRGMVRGAVVACFEGVADRDAAERLRGLSLHVPRERLPATGDDEYYHADLIGLRAEVVAGDEPPRPLGVVSAVEDFGAGPVLEIAVEGKPPVMVPFTREVVPVVELAGGRIGVVGVPGLLDAEPTPSPPPEDE
ncbi:MAG: ribosome maturation factor RimM [Rhodospirillales bacterium]